MPRPIFFAETRYPYWNEEPKKLTLHLTVGNSTQMSAEPVQRILPGYEGLFLVVARPGVVIEGVLGARINVDLEGHTRGLQCCDEIVPTLICEVADIIRIHPQHRRLDVGHLLQRRGRTVIGN